MALEVEINPLNRMLSEVVDSLAKYEGVKGGGKRIEDPSKIKAPYGADTVSYTHLTLPTIYSV